MNQAASKTSRQIVEQAYTSLYNDVCLYMVRYTADMMAAEDMAQDLFVKLLGVDLITEQTVRQLVFTMAKRMIIDDARHRSFVRKAYDGYCSMNDYADTCSPVQVLQAKEVKEWEQRFLADMSPKRAKVYRMYKEEDMSADDIAAHEGLSKRTVENHIYSSTKQMREKMQMIV